MICIFFKKRKSEIVSRLGNLFSVPGIVRRREAMYGNVSGLAANGEITCVFLEEKL
jgi:hypothetical protein